MKLRAVPLLLLFLFSLSLTGCIKPDLIGTVIHKVYEPEHTLTVMSTEIVRGTLHDNVPNQYPIPEQYFVFLEDSTGKGKKIRIIKPVYDTLQVGRKVTIPRKYTKQIVNPPH